MCWDDYEIEFPTGGLVLVKGGSGTGKTTIFRALYWCLYGTLRGTKPNGKSSKTSVKIVSQYNDNTMTITRKKNPNRLEVLMGDVLYEDIVGQHLINEIYGQETIWKASCYVEQKSRNTFLTSTSSGKTQILNLLAFNTEDPQEIISNIDKLKILHERDYKNNLFNFTKDIEQHKEKLESFNDKEIIDDCEEKSIEKNIREIQETVEIMEKTQKQREVSLGLLEIFNKELENLVLPENKPVLKEEYNNILVMTADGLTSITNEDKNIELDDDFYRSQLSYIEKRNLLSDKIKKMENNIKNTIDCSGFNYDDTINKEYEYNVNKKICDDFGINYSKECLESRLIELRNILDEQKNVKKWKAVEEKSKNLSLIQKEKTDSYNEIKNIKILNNISVVVTKPFIINLDNSKMESIKKEIYMLETEIEHLKKCKDILFCPYCDGKILYVNYGLIPTDEKKASNNTIEEHCELLRNKKIELDAEIVLQHNNNDKNQKEIKKYNEALDKAKKENDIINKKNIESHYKKINIEEKIKNLDKKISNIQEELSALHAVCKKTNVEIMSSAEIQSISTMIQKLSNINILELPKPSSKEIKEYIENKKLLDIVNSNKKDLIDLELKITCDDGIFKKIAYIKSFLKDRKIWQDKLLKHKTTKHNIEEKINSIEKNLPENLSTLINDNNNKIKTLTQKLKTNASNKKIKKIYDKLTIDREKIMLDLENLEKINEIKKIAQDTECAVLENVTSNLTQYTQNILQELFEKYIDIDIKLYKEVKSTKIVKPNVFFEIKYNNNVYDSVSAFSGGEGDRISLSVTLSLHKLSSSPILILDESLASLDVKTKENALNVIRSYSNGTVLIVMHDCTEGYFDHVIQV